jgi:hypothetical protein
MLPHIATTTTGNRPPKHRAISSYSTQTEARRISCIAFLELTIGPRFASWRAPYGAENIQHAPDFSFELAIFSAGLLPAPDLAVIGSDPNFAGAGYDSAVLRVGKFYASDVAGQRRAG